MLTELSLADADAFEIDLEICDWFRTESAAAAIALNEEPHCAFAVTPNVRVTVENTATRTAVMLRMFLRKLLILLFIFLLLNLMCRRASVRRANSGVPAPTAGILSLLINAEIPQETSNDSSAT